MYMDLQNYVEDKSVEVVRSHVRYFTPPHKVEIFINTAS